MESDLEKLPREIRDQIYEALVGTYLIELPEVSENSYRLHHGSLKDFIRYESPAYEEFGRKFLPDGDCVADAAPPIPALSRYPSLAPVSSAVSLLMASTEFRQEATHIIYEGSTFVFVINSPLHDTLSDYACNQMKNIEFRLDLIAAYLKRRSHKDVALTHEYAQRLLGRFAGREIDRKTCVITIECAEHLQVLLKSPFFDTVIRLRGFETVMVKLIPSCMSNIYADLYTDPRISRDLPSFARANQDYMARMVASIRFELGYGTASQVVKDHYYLLIIHPKQPLEASNATVSVPGLNDEEGFEEKWKGWWNCHKRQACEKANQRWKSLRGVRETKLKPFFI